MSLKFRIQSFHDDIFEVEKKIFSNDHSDFGDDIRLGVWNSLKLFESDLRGLKIEKVFGFFILL